ncbi:MAG: aconitase X catalytic domain-containing protein [Deltaproteobacteria bacterium]|nr:aconitase X catalytic domain-containing protein [Deltaproteobacteria bacterium]
MKLTDEEKAMLQGIRGEAVRRGMEMQVAVGEFFGAEDMVQVQSAHVMCTSDALDDAGATFLEELAGAGGRFVVPTTTNAGSVEFDHVELLQQDPSHVALQRRIDTSMVRMGALNCCTCTNYQGIMPPRFGEHLAWGDTGAVIFANAVAGARSNFEGGPAAVAAGLTGRTPRYGFHLDATRRGTVRVVVQEQPRTISDWGTLGCFIGRKVDDYWQVPVLEGNLEYPDVDRLKHLGASLASYGSLAMFHIPGITPEIRSTEEAFGLREPDRIIEVHPGALRETYDSFPAGDGSVDLVIFGTPHLSLMEVHDLARRLEGKRVNANVKLLLTTSSLVKSMAERLGLVRIIEEAGGTFLCGVCFYLMYPAEIARKLGVRSLATNSAKLANIIAGAGIRPVLRDEETCIQAAVTGRVE